MSEEDLKNAEKTSKVMAEELNKKVDLLAKPMVDIEISDEEYDQLGDENQNNQQSEKQVLKLERKKLIEKFNSELNLIQIKRQELIAQKNENDNEEINKQINELDNYEKSLKENIPSLAGINKYLHESKFFNGIKNHKNIINETKNILNILSIQTTAEEIDKNIDKLKEILNKIHNENLKKTLFNKIEEKRRNINENNNVDNNTKKVLSEIIKGVNHCVIKPYELGKESLKALYNSQKIVDLRFEQILNKKPKFLLNQQQKENIIEENKKNEEIKKDNNLSNSNLNTKIQNLREEKNIFVKAWNFLKNMVSKIFFKKTVKANQDMEKQLEIVEEKGK